MSAFLRMESAPDLAPTPRGVSPSLRVVAGADPAVLLDIVRPAVGLAIRARALDDALVRDAAFLTLPVGATTLRASGEPPALARQLARALPDGCPSWFETEIEGLALLFGTIAACARLQARFGAFPDDGAPEELRLCCRYGPGPLRWKHPGDQAGSGETDDDEPGGGAADPFAVMIVKGARSSIRRRRALRLLPDRAGDPVGPVLLIEPEPEKGARA